MNEITSKYILFAVGLFIVVIILSSLIFAYSSVQDVYKTVVDTDISIKDKYDSIYYTYHDAVMNGVDLVNALKRFEDDDKVEVYYPGTNSTQNRTKEAIDFFQMHVSFQMPSCTESEYLNMVMSGEVIEGCSVNIVTIRMQNLNITTFRYKTEFKVTVDFNHSTNKYEIIFERLLSP